MSRTGEQTYELLSEYVNRVQADTGTCSLRHVVTTTMAYKLISKNFCRHISEHAVHNCGNTDTIDQWPY